VRVLNGVHACFADSVLGTCDGLSGAALRRARRQKIAELRYLSRPLQRPASNTSDAGGPGCAVDGGGHGGAGHG